MLIGWVIIMEYQYLFDKDNILRVPINSSNNNNLKQYLVSYVGCKIIKGPTQIIPGDIKYKKWGSRLLEKSSSS